MNDTLWTADDVAAYLKIAVKTVRNKRHHLPPPIYIGRLPRWSPATVKKWALAGGTAMGQHRGKPHGYTGSDS